MPRSHLSSARIHDTHPEPAGQPPSLFSRTSPVAAEAALEILDRLGPAMMLLREDATLLWMNRKAERLVRDHDLPLHTIPCCNRQVQSKRHYDRDGRCVLTMTFPLERSSDSSVYVVIVAPLEPGRECDSEMFSPRLLQSAFGLTPAEARVAVSVAAGYTLSETAVESHVAESTVRTQIKSVFRKTGVRRQTDLVRRVMAMQGLLLNLRLE